MPTPASAAGQQDDLCAEHDVVHPAVRDESRTGLRADRGLQDPRGVTEQAVIGFSFE